MTDTRISCPFGDDDCTYLDHLHDPEGLVWLAKVDELETAEIDADGPPYPDAR